MIKYIILFLLLLNNGLANANPPGTYQPLFLSTCSNPITVFTAIQDNDSAGNGGFSFRNTAAQSPATGGSQVRTTWSAITGYTLNTSSVCIATSGGACGATPIQLLYNGAASAVVPGSGSLTSDWANLTSLSSDSFLVIGDVNAGTGTIGNKSTTGNSWFKSGATYNIQSPAGLTSSVRIWMVTKVEVRTCS